MKTNKCTGRIDLGIYECKKKKKEVPIQRSYSFNQDRRRPI